MKLMTGAILLAMLAQPASAQDVGIAFDRMAVGTRWVTELLEKEERTEETYLGREGDFHITERYRISPTGERRFIFRNTYDSEGRWLRGERNGQATSYTPFSCRYVVGDCTETGKIPHAFEAGNTQHLESTSSYVNRLENGVFYLGTVLSDGSVREYPYKLGPYNLRVELEYENLLGEKRGFRLVELVEP